MRVNKSSISRYLMNGCSYALACTFNARSLKLPFVTEQRNAPKDIRTTCLCAQVRILTLPDLEVRQVQGRRYRVGPPTVCTFAGCQLLQDVWVQGRYRVSPLTQATWNPYENVRRYRVSRPILGHGSERPGLSGTRRVQKGPFKKSPP